MNIQELNREEMQATNGGLLGLGGDSSILKIVSEGYINISRTDEDGDTESTNLSFGTASLFESMND